MKNAFCLIGLVVFPIASFGQITEAKLTASDGEANDYFGHSASLSSDLALIGAYADDDNGTDAGSAYIFHFDGSNWVQEEKLTASDGAAYDNFGNSVSLSDNYALIGANGDDEDRRNDGSAYIFHFEGSWLEGAKLFASDGAVDDHFGSSVSLFGNYALIGALGDDDNGGDAGSCYIFHFDGASWVEEAKLTASDGTPTANFGNSVSLSGDYALIGAYGDDGIGASVGAAYIFHFDGSSWVEEAKLTASDANLFDSFGNSVSLSGDYALVGAYAQDDNGIDAGSAYIFHFDGSRWVEEAKLNAGDGSMYDYFGTSVSLSGDYALVGSALDSDNGVNSGSSYVFHFNETNWVEEAKLIASDGSVYEYFGTSVSLSDDYALIGAFWDDVNGIGSAYVYAGLTPLPPTLVATATLSSLSGNGTFDYTLDFTNLTDSSLTVDIWTQVSGPGGRTKTGNVATDKTLEGGRSYSESGTATLDAGTPPGDYVFTVSVGEYPDVVSATASATYSKTTLDKREVSLATGVPTNFELSQNHPNPFNPSTMIAYELPRNAHVRLEVYDMLGQGVRVLVDAPQEAGYHRAIFDAEGLPGGIYLYRLQAGEFVQTRKLLMLK